MTIKSQALEVNIASSQVEVQIDPQFGPLQAVMAKYFGLTESVNTFLRELCHPYRNWEFIVQEARGLSLDYFHLLQSHPQGPAAARLYVKIFRDAIQLSAQEGVCREAVDNLLLFLQKIASDAGSQLPRFIPVLDEAFHKIRFWKDEGFFLFLKSYYQINRIARLLAERQAEAIDEFQHLIPLVARYYTQTYQFWLSQPDPLVWFEKEAENLDAVSNLDEVFEPITHRQILSWQDELEEILSHPGEALPTLNLLVHLPGYNDFVEAYRTVPRALFELGKSLRRGNRWKVLFLFHSMNIPGLALIREETLREINRAISWLIVNSTHHRVLGLIEKTFKILKERTWQYPATALNCVSTMGNGVYQTDDGDLVRVFIDAVVDLGFQAPRIQGVGNDWQIRANTVHLLNIRTWLELIELNPKWSTRLLSSLIIHLSLSGVLIKDTDLFPRDITRLLNAPIRPVYNLAKQLTRLFPAFFNDIGAEGELREISTRLDEITRRRDLLIHFLRKQSHVESSNRIIGFMEATIGFWLTCKKRGLKPYLPPSLYKKVETQGPYIDGVHRALAGLRGQGLEIPQQLRNLSQGELSERLARIPKLSATDRERIQLLANFYQLLHQKYKLDFTQIQAHIERLRAAGLPNLNALEQALEEPDLKKRIDKLLNFMEGLKATILSREEFPITANIYKKRHFTVDIPSMYGSYHELKFDALGLTFRIEALVNVLFEELVESIDLRLITKATIFDIYDRLGLFLRGLALDGLRSGEFDHQLEFLSYSLQVRGFTFTQYLDIFKGFALSVKNIINDNFDSVHEANLNRILGVLPTDQILDKYLPLSETVDRERLNHRVSEIFFREQIALSLGLQQLDRFITRILNVLYHQSEKLSEDKLRSLLLYDPGRAMTPIHPVNQRIAGIIHLGNKGGNLVRLKELGLPVPPGFIITTEVFRCREIIADYAPAQENLNDQVRQRISALETASGKVFGSPENPLLLSVRSGSAISQPGMMDTFLNVGLNEAIAEKMAETSGNPWFAWDNYRRFIQCFGMAKGIARDDFDAIISHFKEQAGLPFKRGFSGDQMREVALAYKSYVQEKGHALMEDPWDQLNLTINTVLNSWQSNKARAYRRIMGISEDWGTAVTVQSMVFGNRSRKSGSGVVFTHNPRWAGDTLRLWGDFTIGNQGEDVVSGLVNTLPISLIQQESEMRPTDITLETHFPEIYHTLYTWAVELVENQGWSPQEIEFTFEGPGLEELYLLQSRDMAMRGRKKVLTFDFDGSGEERIFGHGVGVSGGAMSGRIVFDLSEITHWRKTEPQTALILLRSDTVPDDIREIHAADGLLTARGGLTSHAAVVAHRLDKTCVVGCGNLVCDEKIKECYFNGLTVKSGEFISIDGQEGSVYQGALSVNEV
ncbi:MAG: PEP/pyruvate-binding domain-containing protein [Desulfobacterales bacterium]